MQKGNKQQLLDTLYLTRKCRIEAAERYKKLDEKLSIINIYYSVVLIIFSIITISSNNSNVSISLISSSILAFAFNTVAILKNYKAIYLSLKQNYISIHKLYNTLMPLNENDDFSEYYIKYKELLDSCENHSTYDYYTVLLNDENLLNIAVEQGKLKENTIKYYHKKKVFFNNVVMVICISAPFALPFIIQMISNLLKCIK